MVLLPLLQGSATHVYVDHRIRPRLLGHHRKRAGVGKQIEHFLAPRPLFQPLPARLHIEEETGVLTLAQANGIARLSPPRPHRLRHGAPGALRRHIALIAPLYQHRLQTVALRQLDQAVDNGLLELLIVIGFKKSHPQHRRVQIHRHLLIAWVHATPAVKQPPGVGLTSRLSLQRLLQQCIHPR